MYTDNNKIFGGRAVNAVENDVRSLTRIAFTYISFYVEKSLQHYNMSFNYIKRLYFLRMTESLLGMKTNRGINFKFLGM